jgi:hypothetical protein
MDVYKRICALDLTGPQKAVLVCYASHADFDTGVAYPGVRRVAKLTGFNKDTVASAVRVLIAAGLMLPLGRAYRLSVVSENPDGQCPKTRTGLPLPLSGISVEVSENPVSGCPGSRTDPLPRTSLELKSAASPARVSARSAAQAVTPSRTRKPQVSQTEQQQEAQRRRALAARAAELLASGRSQAEVMAELSSGEAEASNANSTINASGRGCQ